jgi:hypothetical protein
MENRKEEGRKEDNRRPFDPELIGESKRIGLECNRRPFDKKAREMARKFRQDKEESVSPLERAALLGTLSCNIKGMIIFMAAKSTRGSSRSTIL